MATRRYDLRTGFVTTPRYFDDSPQQFLQVAPERTGAIQRVMHVEDYQYKLDERTRNFELLREGAICLGESYCQVIGQVGSNWVHCSGTTPAEIEEFCDDVSAAAGARFFMAGHCLVEGLREIGAKTITVANGYYRDYPDDIMIAAAVDAHQRAPDADAIVQTGAGFRMVQVVDAVEQQTGKTVVGSDFALYWAMLKHVGAKAQPRRYIDISEAPDRVKQIYEQVLPHYEHLHQHRLAAA